MARLYSNENFPLPAVQALPALGHDVLTSQDAGNAGRAIPDEEVLGFAASEQRAVLTLNRRHFIVLHAKRLDHAGVIVCTVDADFEGQARRIDAAIRTVGSLDRQLVRGNRPAK